MSRIPSWKQVKWWIERSVDWKVSRTWVKDGGPVAPSRVTGDVISHRGATRDASQRRQYWIRFSARDENALNKIETSLQVHSKSIYVGTLYRDGKLLLKRNWFQRESCQSSFENAIPSGFYAAQEKVAPSIDSFRCCATQNLILKDNTVFKVKQLIALYSWALKRHFCKNVIFSGDHLAQAAIRDLSFSFFILNETITSRDVQSVETYLTFLTSTHENLISGAPNI